MCVDADFPAIDVYVGDELAAVVEFNPLKNKIYFHTYKKNKGEVHASHAWDEPSEYDETSC